MIEASLVPETFFEGFRPESIWVLWVMAAGAIGVLVYGADRLVSGAVRLAKAMGLPTVVIGATVVSLGTTTPEACVSVNAALHGEPGLALGNGVGSIICDTALIFGLCCCLTRLPKNRYILNHQGWMQFGSGLLLSVIAAGLLWQAAAAGAVELPGWLTAPSVGEDPVLIPRWIGLGLLALLAVYLYLSVRWSRDHAPDTAHVDKVEPVRIDPRHKWRVAGVSLSLLGVGLAMVVGGSEVLIGSVKQICLHYSVPEEVLAVTLVALGTSLPELVTAIAAIVKGHGGLMVGNIIGADVLNVLFVIGASSTAVPLAVKPMFFVLYLPIMMLALVMLRVFIWMPGHTFRRWQGVPLLALYVVFCWLTVTYGIAG